MRALLAAEGIASGAEDETLLAQVVAADINAHPWTDVDVAHTRVSCPDCGAETGAGTLRAYVPLLPAPTSMSSVNPLRPL